MPDLVQLESFSSVHQLVSTVRGLRRAGVSTVEAIRAAFPGGSMTGAPKIRSMALLDDLEGAARGIYSGALGYLSVNDTFDLNIVIRTAVFTKEQQQQQQGAAQADTFAGRSSSSDGLAHSCLDSSAAHKWHMSVGSGGAIVVLSDDEAEFAEMQLKAEKLVQTVALAEQEQSR